MKKTWLCYVLFIFNLLLVIFQAAAQQKTEDKESLVRREAEIFAKIQLANAQQTQNQSNYDVRHYDINLDMNPSAEMLVGDVGIDADVVNDPINFMEVNLLNNMQVNKVELAGQIVTFTHANDMLNIDLDRTYQPGEKLNVTISYQGNPTQTGFGSFGFDSYNGDPMIWSLSEPFGARNWWPCKDIPVDKADSVDMRLTVPENLTAVSNGLLRTVDTQNGKKIYWWHEGYPITTYLVSVAIYPYIKFSDSLQVVPGKKMQIDYYVFSDYLDFAKQAYTKTPNMIQLFSKLFLPYPFYKEKYGHAMFLGGAYMEHQTITSLLPNVGEYTIAHELSHQWWGDMITCRDFGHIWLNEGFATYSEALWGEYTYGEETYRQMMTNRRYFGGGTIFVSQLDVGTIFNYNRSYLKGSWVLHMLRHVVGDSTFFNILHEYGSDPRFKFGTATTEDFQQVCESVAGMDLSDFFHQWIYEEYYPQYHYAYDVKDSSDLFVTMVNIRQKQQNTGIFHMPIDLKFDFGSTDTTISVDNFLADQTYRFVFAQKPQSVQLDADNWILKNVQEDTNQPDTLTLMQGYPNPFHDNTKIGLFLKKRSMITVHIFDLLGREIKTLYQGNMMIGEHQFTWDGVDQRGNVVPSGIYFCRVASSNQTKVIKLVKFH